MGAIHMIIDAKKKFHVTVDMLLLPGEGYNQNVAMLLPQRKKKIISSRNLSLPIWSHQERSNGLRMGITTPSTKVWAER